MGLSRCNSQIFSFENRKVKSVSGTMDDKKELEKMNSNVTIWERIFSDNRLLNCRQTKPRYVFHRWRHEVKNAEGTKLFRSGLYLETERVWAKETPFSRTIHVLSVHVAIISGLVWTAVNGLLDVSCPSK
nr:uncharacterized protein LOC131785763 [Pocillopora verrucosa]